MAYHFEHGAEDQAWLNFLVREALTAGEAPIAHEAERQPVIERQVDEVRRRQAAGLIPTELDRALVRLMGVRAGHLPARPAPDHADDDGAGAERCALPGPLVGLPAGAGPAAAAGGRVRRAHRNRVDLDAVGAAKRSVRLAPAKGPSVFPSLARSCRGAPSQTLTV